MWSCTKSLIVVGPCTCDLCSDCGTRGHIMGSLNSKGDILLWAWTTFKTICQLDSEIWPDGGIRTTKVQNHQGSSSKEHEYAQPISVAIYPVHLLCTRLNFGVMLPLNESSGAPTILGFLSWWSWLIITNFIYCMSSYLFSIYLLWTRVLAMLIVEQERLQDHHSVGSTNIHIILHGNLVRWQTDWLTEVDLWCLQVMKAYNEDIHIMYWGN